MNGFTILHAKKFLKGMFFSSIDEEKEKDEIQARIAGDQLTKEQKECRKTEKMEQREMFKKRNNPSIVIDVAKMAREEGSCRCQILRSSSSWSTGVEEKEDSIYTAYMDLIETSEHFIYIENQFFISNPGWTN
jgi:phosphatidylserine/phosphatidylglycerophosphate/cardiolipin synthase-like enzyme